MRHRGLLAQAQQPSAQLSSAVRGALNRRSKQVPRRLSLASEQARPGEVGLALSPARLQRTHFSGTVCPASRRASDRSMTADGRAFS